MLCLTEQGSSVPEIWKGTKRIRTPGGEAYLITDKKQKIRVADEESFSNASKQDKNRGTQEAENTEFENWYE